MKLIDRAAALVPLDDFLIDRFSLIVPVFLAVLIFLHVRAETLLIALFRNGQVAFDVLKDGRPGEKMGRVGGPFLRFEDSEHGVSVQQVPSCGTFSNLQRLQATDCRPTPRPIIRESDSDELVERSGKDLWDVVLAREANCGRRLRVQVVQVVSEELLSSLFLHSSAAMASCCC